MPWNPYHNISVQVMKSMTNLNFINSLIRLELGFTFALSRWADSHHLVFDNNMRMYHNSVNTSARWLRQH